MSEHSAASNNISEAESGLTVIESKPVHAWIAFTGRCNLSCVHCPRQSYVDSSPSAGEMSRETFTRVAKQVLPLIETCKIGGNNLGEQLLAREWDYFFDEMRRFSFRRLLVTNGISVADDRLRALIESAPPSMRDKAKAHNRTAENFVFTRW